MSKALPIIDNIINSIDSALSDDSSTPSSRVSIDSCKACRADIASLIKEKGCGPILVRLAWHDSGTYCTKSNTGGPRAAQRFSDGESKHGANAGLDIARNLLSKIQGKYCNNTHNISIADLWTLAGTVAIAEAGGPNIPFRFGRTDINSSKQCVEEGRLPDGDKGLEHLRNVFGRMGFTDSDIVTLSGAHTLGSCHADRSGFKGSWTADPKKFNNQFYVDLVNKKWVKTKVESTGNPQLKVANDDKDDTMMLISDHCLIQRKETKGLVEKYAKDQKAFFNDFSRVWTKLIQGGYKNLYEAK